MTNPHAGERGHVCTLVSGNTGGDTCLLLYWCDWCQANGLPYSFLGMGNMLQHRMSEEIKRLKWELEHVTEAARVVLLDYDTGLTVHGTVADPNMEELRYRLQDD